MLTYCKPSIIIQVEPIYTYLFGMCNYSRLINGLWLQCWINVSVDSVELLGLLDAFLQWVVTILSATCVVFCHVDVVSIILRNIFGEEKGL